MTILFIIFVVLPFIFGWVYASKGPTGFEMYPHAPMFLSPPDQDQYYANIKGISEAYDNNPSSLTSDELVLYYQEPERFKKMFGWYPKPYREKMNLQ